jgi:Tfp pilus assembly protein PilN
MKVFKWISMVTALAALGTAVYLYWRQASEIAEMERRMGELEPRWEELASVRQAIGEFEKISTLVEHTATLINHLRSPSERNVLFPDDLLAQLASSLPPRLQVDRLLVQEQLIEVSGRADDATSVTRWGQSLEGLGILSEFDLRRFDPSSTGGTSNSDFTLAGRLVPLPPLSQEAEDVVEIPAAKSENEVKQ